MSRVTRSSLSGDASNDHSKNRDRKAKQRNQSEESQKRKKGPSSSDDDSDEDDDDAIEELSQDDTNEEEEEENEEFSNDEGAEEDDFKSDDESDDDDMKDESDDEKDVATKKSTKKSTPSKKNTKGKANNSSTRKCPAHMRKIGLSADILTTADQIRTASLARHRNILKPFITEKVYNMLSAILQKRGSDTADLKKTESISQPKSLMKCTMRNYQLEGLSWLVNNYNQRINCMLGDEMGLGKTLQSISFVAYMLHVKKISGPFLFVVPLTVLFNWMNEFRKWCPTINVLRVHTTDPTEQERLKSLIADPKTEVVVTTYEIIKTGGLSQVLRRVVWRGTFLDEGHRIRNEDSIVARACCGIRSEFKVILTGTPLQNNLRETGGLLKFLAPNIFTDLSLFDNAFNLNSSSGGGALASTEGGGGGGSSSGSGLQIDRELLNKAHYMMRPFLLRRIKSEVEQKLPPKIETKVDCPMTETQKRLTQFLLFRQRALLAKLEQRLKEKIAKEKQRQQQLLLQQQEEQAAAEQANRGEPAEVSTEGQEPMDISTNEQTSKEIDEMGASNDIGNSSSAKKKARKRTSESAKLQENATGGNTLSASDTRGIQGLLAHLRKAANHPFLFEGVEKVNPDGTPTEEIVTTSGKMIILDKLLTKLKAKGHRVVLFSQFTHTLDIICDFLEMRGHLYQRLDGSTNRVMREVRINLFNKPNSEYFIFALSTRAGGEGVNLYTADTVILFDSDWNPQVDIQAMARVHRIGQTKIVHVYRLVTKGSIDECIVHRAQKKLFLDSMVNRGSTSNALALDKQIQEEKQRRKLEQKHDDEEERSSKRQKLEGDDEGEQEVDNEEEDSEGDGQGKANEDGADEDEFDMMNATRLFTTLKFGWNSAFSAGSSDSKQPEEMISDADIELIIDRTRGIDSAGNATATNASITPGENNKGSSDISNEKTIQSTDEIGGVPSSENAVAAAVVNKELSTDNKLKENQEISIDTFDEHVPLVKIDNIREQSLLDLENQFKSAYEQGDKDALTNALGGDVADNQDSNEISEMTARGRPKRQVKSRTETIHVVGVGPVSVLRSSIFGGLNDAADNEKGNASGAVKKKSKNILEGFRGLSDSNNTNNQNSSLNGGMVLPTSNSLRQVAGRDYQHQDVCQICWDGGEVLVCDGCPCSYHLSCLGLKKVPGDFMWYCPHHSCATCHRKIQAAGLLFRCMYCEHAYCEDCLPAEAEIVGECQRFRDLGFRWPSNACYIKCSIDCIEFDPNAPPSQEKDEDEEDHGHRKKKSSSKRRRKSKEADDHDADDDSIEGSLEDEDKEKSDDESLDSRDATAVEGEAGAAIENGQSNRYNPLLALAFCSLKDIKDRLTRDDNYINSRFKALAEVPNFAIRYEKAPLIARLTIQHLINFVMKHDSILETEDNHDLEDDAGATAAANEDEGKEQSQDQQSIQTILKFSGISPKHSFQARARIFLAAVKILANTNKAALPQIAQALGICHARYIRPPTKVEASMNYVNYSHEPKFCFPLNTQRRLLEEAIAAFLVILSPQNLVLPAPGKGESANPVKKDIAGMLYTSRCLQALGEPLFDSNNFYFTSYQLRDVTDAGVRDWVIRYPTGKGVDSQTKTFWMFPCVRLLISMKSFLKNGPSKGGGSADDASSTGGLKGSTATASDSASIETAKERVKEWLDIDNSKLNKHLTFCEETFLRIKRDAKLKLKQQRQQQQQQQSGVEGTSSSHMDYDAHDAGTSNDLNDLMQNTYHEMQTGATSGNSSLNANAINQALLIQQHQQRQLQQLQQLQQMQQQQQQLASLNPQISGNPAALAKYLQNQQVIQQQHQQLQQQQFNAALTNAALGNNNSNVLLPSLPPLPAHLQHIIPTNTSLNNTAVSSSGASVSSNAPGGIDRARVSLQMEQQRLIAKQKEEQKKLRIQKEEERLNQEKLLLDLQQQRVQQQVATTSGQPSQGFPLATTPGQFALVHKLIDISSPKDLIPHISIIHESKLMFDWLVSVHDVLFKFATTEASMKAMIGLQDPVTASISANNPAAGSNKKEYASTYYTVPQSAAIAFAQNMEKRNQQRQTMPSSNWRLSVNTQQRQSVIAALSVLLDKLESILNIRSHSDKCRKLQLYELALLSIASSVEEYVAEATIPQRLATMLASFQKYIVDTMIVNPLLMQEVQNIVMKQHEEQQQQMILQAQLFQQQKQQQLLLGQLFGRQ